VTDADRVLAALVAAFRPAAAGTLLARLAGADAPDVAREARRLAGRTRRERLAALAGALAAVAASSRPAPAAGRERAAIVEAFERLRRGASAPEVAPALVRLWLQRGGG
jgi:hypothetical protein